VTNVNPMARFAGILHRHGLTLLLTGAMVALYLRETMPAVHELNATRVRRASTEVQLLEQKQVLYEGMLWLRGAVEDPFVRERFRDAYTWSPDLKGPRVIVPLSEWVGMDAVMEGIAEPDR